MNYRRIVDLDSGDSLAKLARWIRPGATVLELGAAVGYFTAHLQAAGCTVDAVEIDPAAAAEAAPHARRMVVADLDTDAWVEPLGDARYDVIVCADVIEHLRAPDRLLARARERLAEGGELLLSVPNVAHTAIVANLLDERFDYGGEGLLDPTHVRLYTWRSLRGLLAAAGLTVRAWDATLLASFDTEFRVRVETLQPALRDALVGRAHAHVYQWLARAGVGGADAGEPPATLTAERVPVRLLCAASADALSLDVASTAHVPIGGGAVECSWPIAAGSGALRLLLADRVGVVRIDRCRLHAGPDVVWELGLAGAALCCSEGAIPLGEGRYAVVRPDAWVEPDVASATLARADRMSATLAWPANVADGGDYSTLLLLAKECARTRSEAQAVLEARSREFEQAIAAERAAHADTRQARAQAENALGLQEARVGELLARERELTDAVAAHQADHTRLEAALAAQERIIAYRQSLRGWLALPLLRLRFWWRRVAHR